MRYSNKTISLIINLLLINIVCITCPSSEENEEEGYPEGFNPDLERCVQEIYSEFGVGDNVHDLLYGFLNIKFLTHFWHARTNINEMIYEGEKRLSRLTSGYYSDLFYTALEVNGLSEIPTPRQFCDAYDGIKQAECLRDIQAFGCAPDLNGSKCAEHLYFFWKKPDEPEPLEEALNISTESILEAIYRGRDYFRTLSEEQLINTISRQLTVFDELSDRQLLEDIGFDQNKYYKIFDEDSVHPDKVIRDEEYHRQFRHYVHDVRFRRYGIGTVSYANLCDEYIRRCKESKASIYAKHIHDTLKDCCDTSQLPNRYSYCEKYLSEKTDDD